MAETEQTSTISVIEPSVAAIFFISSGAESVESDIRSLEHAPSCLNLHKRAPSTDFSPQQPLLKTKKLGNSSNPPDTSTEINSVIVFPEDSHSNSLNYNNYFS